MCSPISGADTRASASGLGGRVAGGLDYVFGKNFGLGGAYQYVKINASHSGTSGDLAFTYKYEGPLAYLILVF